MPPELTMRDFAVLKRLFGRFFTPAGNFIGLAVGLGAGNVAVTFPRVMSSGNFGVMATPNWNTTVWVTAKGTTGCTVNFGTVAPANATVDVITFDSE